jgi:hypothetical protein
MMFFSVALMHLFGLKRYVNFFNECAPKEFFSDKNPLQMFGIITFLGCYFAGINYDYRLAFLAVYLLMDSLGRPYDENFQWFAVLSVGIFWMSYNSWYFQLLGDLLILFFVASLILQFLDSKKNTFFLLKRNFKFK